MTDPEAPPSNGPDPQPLSTPPPPGVSMLPPDTFTGHVALVTGGGTGIGRAIATEFARTGAAVAIVSRDEAHRRAGVEAVEAVGGTATQVGADIRDPDAIATAFDVVEDQLGPITILVNNAAGNFEVPAEQMSANAWRAVIQIVLDGTFYCSTEFARRRLEAGGDGAILNLGAAYSWTGGPGAAHSAAAKAATANLTMSLGVEWASDGIRVNNLVPGVFPHDDQDEHWGKGRQERSIRRSTSVPLGRVGELRELAWAATYLCSPYAAYVTGASFIVDGANWLRRHAFSTPEHAPPRYRLDPSSD